LEKQVKRDKEKTPMRSRVQSADSRKRRAVNKIHRWLEGFNPDSVPVGQSNRPMVSQEIGRWRKEKAVLKGIRQNESMVEVSRSTIGNGSRVSF
jgi:hypothetical protein